MASASDIYHRAIQALAQEAIGEGRLEHPSGTAYLDNPLCGDCVDMQVDVHGDRIRAIGHKVRGCLLCRASASLIGKHALGATQADIAQVATVVGTFLREQGPLPEGWPDLDLFSPVRGHASRYSCVELPFKALLAALPK